ncbi:hypothetical protein CYANOKiyG1_42780 [Okeania sp. KiyG1]|nr:hypothetical protein CYANOKiyG1_42780 [Okeania sp. KiyG1]
MNIKSFITLYILIFSFIQQALIKITYYRTPEWYLFKNRGGDGGMGGWGDGEMRVFFYLQGKLPGVLLGDAGSHPLASPILVPEFPLDRSD